MLFLSRLALICNLFFVAATAIRMGWQLPSEQLSNTIIVIGHFLVLVFSPLVNLLYLVQLLRKKLFATVPRWLVLTNFIFLLLQVQFIIIYPNSKW
ncbi:hypothetical protein [Flaviaesturariibacter amylovorans]|uniref:Uncharacterized protein n=1 Tax=Flaviaesturariibacter amylovorans TaxID=1084520 RepID=A0ABP8H361_9BACT